MNKILIALMLAIVLVSCRKPGNRQLTSTPIIDSPRVEFVGNYSAKLTKIIPVLPVSLEGKYVSEI
jgi:hypothetical protein